MSRRRCDPACACADAMRWLEATNHDLAPLTGQDARALRGIAHCWRLYSVGDVAGQRAALGAVAALMEGLQRNCWPLARELIAWAMDWDDRERVWSMAEEVHAAFSGNGSSS